MTNEQIDATIAEACGWTDIFEHPEFGLMGVKSETHGCRTAVEHYSGDLNAMHDAEATLTNANMHVMEVQLKYVLSAGEFYFHATARQRAEAFLRTLGKWSATDKESLTVGATTEESSEVQSTSSSGSGGASTYGGNGLGIAGATWPPETRITVNGKTFCLADIDKEMTE
ncbi:hypothetical protein UFOVP917_25 [uncultured Caudovirales phage]|uniref:Uncharacterized protein n=1 Tax=uncultured Caudovirales phage TaxID=2100421 RepID=A0A6J5PIF7_9CAUD|nr:hypothetical protein UFOVP297_3 [uncultured Caudovirales phage]CAB4171253.1 hypothetical protein UFOVP917_25 [uncultured Caudovirales phage]CAB4182849.1 hypothetical protein UFOVP1094_27 [uncultured Caudovirales phage]CAB4200230.1 hypothetical protein UFOVP1342_27 [uncultured Caudovirales phage]CAB4213494.1 hypothetical protein UFOVP1450_31 [uncultured Caudovirales phage]